MRFRLARRIERKTMDAAARVVFTAEYTREIYSARYPGLRDKSVLIPNGYDEANFPKRQKDDTRSTKCLTFVHSGALQPAGRNPRSFFEALSKLKEKRTICASRLQIVFRASGFEEEYRKMADDLGVSDLVALKGYIPYDQAIEEMANADALLVFQGSAFNHAVPAKLYEYLYARKPILGILDKTGETQRVLKDVGITNTASIHDAEEIAKLVGVVIDTIGEESPFLGNPLAIEQYSRRNQTRKLRSILEEIVMPPAQDANNDSCRI